MKGSIYWKRMGIAAIVSLLFTTSCRQPVGSPSSKIVIAEGVLEPLPTSSAQPSPIQLLSTTQLRPEQIAQIAKSQTVLIEVFANNGNDTWSKLGWGSGVIIAQQRSTNTTQLQTQYTVLTNDHVVCSPPAAGQSFRCRDDLTYTINLHDGTRINAANQPRRFGDFPDQTDLAIVTFTSTNQYQPALLGDSNQIQEGSQIYVAGYPSRMASNMSQEPRYAVSPGFVSNRSPTSNGYEIDYTATTWRGMSGGPVFDGYGRLIGIHGRANYDAREVVNMSETQPTPARALVETGFNQGIPINTFIANVTKNRVVIAGLLMNPSFLPQVPLPQNNLASVQDFYLSALSRAERRDYPGALQDINQAIALSPQSNPQSSPQNADLYFTRGNIHLKQGDLRRAIADYDTAIQLNQNFVEAYLNRGVARLGLDDVPGALEDYQKAAEISSDYAPALANQASLYAYLDQYPARDPFRNPRGGRDSNRGSYRPTGCLDDASSDCDPTSRGQAIANYKKAADLFKRQGQLQEYNSIQQKLKQLEQ